MSRKSRTVLVTGASRGIGLAISRALLDSGYRVIGIARKFDEKLLSEDNFEAVSLDLSEIDSLESALKSLLKSHPDIDAVISNAGQGHFGSLEQFSVKQIQDVIDINLIQHILVARAFLPHLKTKGKGDLIIMGSESALAGGRKGALYCTCKFGLRGLAQSLRLDAAQSGVRVGIINPGMVDTSFFEELDFEPGHAPENSVSPDDVAGAVLTFIQAAPGTVIDEINLSPLKKVVRSKSRK